MKWWYIYIYMNEMMNEWYNDDEDEWNEIYIIGDDRLKIWKWIIKMIIIIFLEIKWNSLNKCWKYLKIIR